MGGRKSSFPAPQSLCFWASFSRKNLKYTGQQTDRFNEVLSSDSFNEVLKLFNIVIRETFITQSFNKSRTVKRKVINL